MREVIQESEISEEDLLIGLIKKSYGETLIVLFKPNSEYGVFGCGDNYRLKYRHPHAYPTGEDLNVIWEPGYTEEQKEMHLMVYADLLGFLDSEALDICKRDGMAVATISSIFNAWR